MSKLEFKIGTVVVLNSKTDIAYFLDIFDTEHPCMFEYYLNDRFSFPTLVWVSCRMITHQPAFLDGRFTWNNYPDIVEDAVSIQNWIIKNIPAYAKEKGITND